MNTGAEVLRVITGMDQFSKQIISSFIPLKLYTEEPLSKLSHTSASNLTEPV